MTACCFYT